MGNDEKLSLYDNSLSSACFRLSCVLVTAGIVGWLLTSSEVIAGIKAD